MAPESLSGIATPAAVVDEARMSRNIDGMARRMRELGVSFRPHVKTSKCVEVARRQLAAGAQGITVSTLREAETFFDAGFTDILYAVGIVPGKLAQARALRARGCNLTLLVDSIEAADALGAGDAVLVEIDSDGHRAGMQPRGEALLQVADRIRARGATLRGVMTHAGESYACSTRAALEAIAERERAEAVLSAQRLRAAGHEAPVVSVGSTPTALAARNLDGVTEVRAGVYVFQDLVMANVGVARPQDLALSVLASVIGHRADRGWTFIDAGWMAVSRDRGTAKQARDYGYGWVCDIDGKPIEGLAFNDTNQEHGILSYQGTGAAPHLTLGSKVRIFPNHACATASQFDEYRVLREDGRVETWPRFRGW